MNYIEEILSLLEDGARSLYLGELVSQRDHALQAAQLAAAESANPSLIAAALLHDVGYLIDPDTEVHEQKGSEWLAQWFGPEVTEPVRLHVVAKRYLCTVNDSYRQLLSAASIRSLDLQGGLLSRDEIRVFESNRYHRSAIRLRHWDDRAKISGRAVADPMHYILTLKNSSQLRP